MHTSWSIQIKQNFNKNKTSDAVTYLPPFGNIIFCNAITQFAPFCLTRIKEHNEKVKIAIRLHYVMAFLKVAKVLLEKSYV